MRRVLVVPLLLWAAVAGSAGAASTAPVFVQLTAPASLTGSDTAGEPSLGFAQDGSLLYQAMRHTYRVDAKGSWSDVTFPLLGVQTADPTLHTDVRTGRTFVNQLQQTGQSVQAYTDDGGRTWTPSVLGAAPGLAFDHPTVGSGVPAGGLVPVGYPDLVYYCTNDLYAATCGTSLDGGATFLPAHPVYVGELVPVGECITLLGHLVTDPRGGTAYVPTRSCGTGPGVFTSTDGATTWTGGVVPGTTDGDAGDPALAVGRQDGALWLAYASADGTRGRPDSTGRVHVTVSRDKGRSWTQDTALGSDLGVVTARFPTVLAGDRGRAAVTFLGSSTKGLPNAQVDPGIDGPLFRGTWKLYVSFTTDDGRTWRTYDALPADPVQRGPICTNNLACVEARNLYEFQASVLGPDGRVVLALADGALTRTDTYRDGHARAALVRQVSGPSLYAGQAPVAVPAVPRPPAAPAGRPLATTGAPALLAVTGLGMLLLSASARRRAVRRPRG